MGLGIGFALFISAFGNFLNAVGYILEKMGHLSIERDMRDDPDVDRNICTDKTWISGFIIYLIGSLMHAWALGQGPQSLFTPMQAVTLASNTILTPIFLDEPLSSADVFATFVICLSVVGSVIFGPKSEETYYVEDLMRMYGNPPFLILTGALCLFALVGWFLSGYFHRQNEADGIKQDGSMGPRYAPYFVVCYSCLGGLGASYNVLFLKSTVTLLEEMPESAESAGFWLILIGLIWANAFLEYWKQKALSQFGALYVVPIFQVILVVGGVVVGAVYFDEFAQLNRFELAMFIVSITFCLIGVGILSASSAGRDDDYYESSISGEIYGPDGVEMTEIPHRDYNLVEEDSDTPDTVSTGGVLPSDHFVDVRSERGGHNMTSMEEEEQQLELESSAKVSFVVQHPVVNRIPKEALIVKRGAEFHENAEKLGDDTDVDAEYVDHYVFTEDSGDVSGYYGGTSVNFINKDDFGDSSMQSVGGYISSSV